MVLRPIQRLQGISLKWKLLIPFLFFAFTGTSTLTVIGLTSQQRLIKQEERKMLLLHYRIFQNELERKGEQAVALASVVAEDKEVQQQLADRDRRELNRHLVHTYVRLKIDYDISQFHFHVPPGVSFLRLHEPTLYGDVLHPQRETIRKALEERRAVWGLEMGKTGFGIRGVVPVFLGPSIVGTVEVGHSFGRTFLQGLHRRWGIDLALYVPGGDHTFETMASATGEAAGRVFLDPTRAAAERDEPLILVAPPGLPDRAILQSPIREYGGKPAAVLEISADRSSIRHRLARTRNLMIMVGALGIVISFLLTYLVAILFIRPIKAIVRGAQEIAEERRESYLEPGFGDEIGTLKNALNRMLAALMERRVQLEEYARNLEKRVQERTADLVASEEKFRTLVENVPLIVYRLLEDGTTEFINSYLTDSLGYDIDEAVGDRDFWFEKILGRDEEAFQDLFETCSREGECRIERVVRDKEGRPLVFLDHAIPSTDQEGRVQWIDGIMMDITGLKQLQERSLRTEEIRLLSEISARMAHEIRNPLSTAGGFARRLRDALPEEDRNRRTAEIIVQEVARMETFLEILLSSIRRVDLHITRVDLNRVLRFWVNKMRDLAGSRNVRIREELDARLPAIHADEERINQAMESLIKHAVVSMPPGDTLEVRSRPERDHVLVKLSFRGERVSDGDLEQFFFPHLEQNPEESVLDLPLSKIIIHRHGGRVDVFRDGDLLITEIELPLRPVAEFLE